MHKACRTDENLANTRSFANTRGSVSSCSHKEEALAADSSDVPLVERHLLVLTRPAPETTIREVTYLSPRYLSTGARHPEAVTATFPPSKTDSGLCWECKSPDARLAQLRSDLLVGAVYGERYGQPPGRGLGADLTA